MGIKLKGGKFKGCQKLVSGSSSVKTVVKCHECGEILLQGSGCIDFDAEKLTPCKHCGCDSVDVDVN